MASRDLQVRPDAQVLGQPIVETKPSATGGDELGLQESILAAVVRRNWWLLIFIGVASAVAGVVAAKYFGRNSAVTEGSLIYSGLPMPPGPEVYQTPRMKTYEEMLVSYSTLEKLRQQRGIEMPTNILAELLVCKSSRDSNLLKIELSWPNSDTAADVLNDLMQLLIETVADHRRRVLREHMQHVEIALLEARKELDNAQHSLKLAREKRQHVFDENGLADSQINRLMTQLSSVQTSIDVKEAERQGLLDQLQRTSEMLTQREEALKSAWVENLVAAVRAISSQFAPQSDKARELAELDEVIQSLGTTAGPDVGGYAAWKARMLLTVSNAGIPLEALQLGTHADLEAQAADLERMQRQLEFALLPLEHQISVLRGRLQDYEGQADQLGDALAGVSADLFEDQEEAVEEAELQARMWSQQLENMRRLETSRVAELAVSLPASAATTRIHSNGKKLFVAAFLATGFVLSLPLFVGEWLERRETAVHASARRLGLPLIADRLLSRYRTSKQSDRHRWDGKGAWEDLRLLALRIQQSARQSGSVIVFSSMNDQLSPVPLVSAVAECLRDREERVILIDANDPLKSQVKIVGQSGESSGSDLQVGDSENATVDPEGLAEYLSGQLDSTGEGLIRASSQAGIDVIPSGATHFPREAFASTRLKDLLETCRQYYTLILVNAPPTADATDIQMLAARADGMVLLMDRKAARDRTQLLAVNELIELRAPIIGVVG